MEWIHRSGLEIGVFPALKALAPGLEVFVATRAGGVSAAPFDSLNLGGKLGDSRENIERNRSRLLRAVGVPRRALAWAEQVHGAEIAVIDRGGLYRGVDGFVTEARDLALAVSTADCYSLVIYSPPERVLAALHVGRKSAEKGIIGKAAAILVGRYRIDPTYAVAVIGPGICRRCYAVSTEDAAPFPPGAKRFERGAWHLDLEAFCRAALREEGVRKRNMISSGLCSACEPSRFFSHRRDRGVTGRLWTVAVVRSGPRRAGQRCD
jgi:YfiH family protein